MKSTYEKPPSNLQVQLTTIANRIEHLRRPYVEYDNLLKRRLYYIASSIQSRSRKDNHALNCRAEIEFGMPGTVTNVTDTV
jgi:hypothetical protein